MTEQTQQDYLRAAKQSLGVTWGVLAEMSGINPRALKTYRMPDSSNDYRTIPSLARRSIDAILAEKKKIRQSI